MITAPKPATAVNNIQAPRSCLSLGSNAVKKWKGFHYLLVSDTLIDRQLIPLGSFVNPSQDLYILIHANMVI